MSEGSQRRRFYVCAEPLLSWPGAIALDRYDETVFELYPIRGALTERVARSGGVTPAREGRDSKPSNPQG